MKGFLKPKLFLTFAAFVMMAVVVAIPLSAISTRARAAAAPLWAAIAALADTFHAALLHEARLGLFNFLVYKFDSPSGYAIAFHDITVGNNGFYPAGPNYDMSTGIGSPNIFGIVLSLSRSTEL